jgi:hypothetical protein
MSMSKKDPLPPLPIAEAADDVVYYEQSEAFRPGGETQLGGGFSNPRVVANFNPPANTLTIRNFKIREAYLDTACMLLIKEGRKIPETAYLLPPQYYENAEVIRHQLVELDDRTEYVIGCNRDRNYYHWLIQAVPAIDWAMRSTPNRPVTLMLPELNAWQSASLELLGYGNIPRVILTPYKHFYFPRVSYSEFLNVVLPGGISRSAQATFRRLRYAVNAPIEQEGQIVYVARTDTARRMAVNERDVMQALAAEGVRVIVPGSLSLQEQIAAFGNADAVIAPHGAGLSNIVFCKPGTVLYEMLPEHYPNNCFTRLAQATGLHYWADMFPSYGEGNEHDKNWTIDIGVVKNRLRDIRLRLAEASSTHVALVGGSGAMAFLKQNKAAIPDTNISVRPQSTPIAERGDGLVSRIWRRWRRV